MSGRHSPIDTALSSAEVITRRLPIMWWGMVNPTAKSQAEMTKMVVEKQMAMAEACFAMQVEMFKMMLTPWGMTGMMEKMFHAAHAPSARRVKANVRRLRR